MEYVRTVHKSTAESSDYTDPSVTLPTTIPLHPRSSGVRFCLIPVDASDNQIPASGMTFTYRIFWQWAYAGKVRRGWSPVGSASMGIIYDDEAAASAGPAGAKKEVAIVITGQSGATAADHLELHMEEI
jgi:hypothetical protein